LYLIFSDDDVRLSIVMLYSFIARRKGDKYLFNRAPPSNADQDALLKGFLSHTIVARNLSGFVEQKVASRLLYCSLLESE
jgi:hypothetical protein